MTPKPNRHPRPERKAQLEIICRRSFQLPPLRYLSLLLTVPKSTARSLRTRRGTRVQPRRRFHLALEGYKWAVCAGPLISLMQGAGPQRPPAGPKPPQMVDRRCGRAGRVEVEGGGGGG